MEAETDQGGRGGGRTEEWKRLTRAGRDPRCGTCAAPRKTPVFPELQTWYGPTHHLSEEETAGEPGGQEQEDRSRETGRLSSSADSLLLCGAAT